MKILIMGASGFVGKNLLLKAPKQWKITAVYHNNPEFPRFLSENKLDSVAPIKCDITDEKSVARLFKEVNDFDVCVYLAANSDPTLSVDNPRLDLKINILGLANFLEYFKGQKMIYFSSGAVYEGLKGKVSPKSRLDPKLPYAISKLAAEQYVKSYHKIRCNFSNYMILRFFGAYGPYEPKRKIYTNLINEIEHQGKKEFTIRGEGSNLIDAMYIDDTTEALIKIIKDKKVSDKVLDFCVGNPLSIKELVKETASALGSKEIKIISKGKTAEPIGFIGSNKELEELFYFTPKIGLKEGIKRFAGFLSKD